MNKRGNVLLASINSRDVGVLRDEGGTWSFEYTASWIEDRESFDLSPHLPRNAGKILDGATERPVQWFFDNLLPEEAARDLLARDAQISSTDAFGLLVYYGKESAGAITLLPPGESRAESDYRLLTDEELHERIRGVPQHSLARGAPKRMSLAGAQHKLAVAMKDGQLFHPVGDAPSTHILKPNHTDVELYSASAANEYFVMRLAQAVGLPVPEVEIRHVPEAVYLVARFDREVLDAQPRRLHAVDACQLLGLDRSFKYRQSSWQSLAACIEYCQNRAQARQRLLEWALFNIMVGNGNAHLKNISFLIRPTGIELAPFYDLVSTESYRAEIGSNLRWPAVPLSMQIGQARTFEKVTREDFLLFGQEIGATERATLRIIDDYANKLETAAAVLHEEYEARPLPALIRAAEVITLRRVRVTCLREMTWRFKSRR